MIWFSVKKIEEKITGNSFQEKEGINYFIAITIVTGLLFGSMQLTSTMRIRFDLITSLIALIITIFGVKTAYKINTKIDEQNFFSRFFAISWVIGLRIIIILIGSTLLIKSILVQIPHKYLCEYSTLIFVLTIMYVLFIWTLNYVLIINSFHRIKKSKLHTTHRI